MLSKFVVSLVLFYRKYLSPLKGFKCAYGVHAGLDTCSGRGLRGFRRAGAVKGYALLQRQFDRCILAAEALRQEHDGAYLGQFGKLRSQRGECDCDPSPGGCDGPDCKDCGPPKSCCVSGPAATDVPSQKPAGRCLASVLADACSTSSSSCCKDAIDSKACRFSSSTSRSKADEANARVAQRKAAREARRNRNKVET